METPEKHQCFLMSSCQQGRSDRYSCSWICLNIYLSIIYFIWCTKGTQWGEQVSLLTSKGAQYYEVQSILLNMLLGAWSFMYRKIWFFQSYKRIEAAGRICTFCGYKKTWKSRNMHYRTIVPKELCFLFPPFKLFKKVPPPHATPYCPNPTNQPSLVQTNIKRVILPVQLLLSIKNQSLIF